jgi:hypothetical protein
VYLVPVGAGRFELYSEPPDEAAPDGESPPADRFWRRTTDKARVRWHEAVHTARGRDASAGWFARLRDRAVCRAAETVAEQRTLWSLRHFTAATLVHSSDLTDHPAAGVRDRLLTVARTQHGKWLVIDTVLLVASGVFMLVPGPNVLAYYFAFRAVGHYLSWRGAQQALQRITWELQPEPALAELGRLAALPREARAPRVEAIARGMNLPRLAAFFERTAVPLR